MVNCTECGQKIKDWWPLAGKIRDVEIAKMFPTSAASVCRYRASRGIPAVKGPLARTKRIIALYEAGASVSSIASTMGCTVSNISQIIKRHLCDTSTPKPVAS